MTKRIVIVGELPQSTVRSDVLRSLADQFPEVEWEWVKCDTPAYNLPKKYFNRLLAQLRNPDSKIELIVVKLSLINGHEQHALYQDCPDPIMAPVALATGDELVDWLLSDDAALVKEPKWKEPVRAAAALAILAKLVKNKSWNNTKNGHQWTKEADLLGQAPVCRPDGWLLNEAQQLLGKMEGDVLLCKGANQGKTPKGWCIMGSRLTPIKRAILDRSLEPLRQEEDWAEVFQWIDQGPEELVTIDDDIVNETVRSRCREHR